MCGILTDDLCLFNAKYVKYVLNQEISDFSMFLRLVDRVSFHFQRHWALQNQPIMAFRVQRQMKCVGIF